METILENLTLGAIEDKISNGRKLTDGEKQYVLKKSEQYWTNHPDVELRFPRWKKYMAWVAGYQYYDYNKYTRALVELPVKRKHRLIFNRLRSFVRALLAKLNADVPSMGVVPKTSQFEDIESARVGEKVIEHLKEKCNFSQMLTNLKLWAIVINRAYIRVFWNEDTHGVVGYIPEQEVDRESGQFLEETEREIRDEGDVGMECVSPLQCRIDPLYFEHDKWRWFMYGEEVDADKIEKKYKLERGTLEDEKEDAYKSAYDLTYYDESLTQGNIATDVTGRTTVFKEFWTPKIWIFIAGKEVLDYGKNDWGEIPFYDIEERLIPISGYERGFQYNESLVKDAIPLQREYNRQKSLISEAIEKAGQLKILMPFGAMLSKRQWVSDYGVFIDYNSKLGAEPHQMRLDPLPAYVQAYSQDLEREMEVVFGVREASFGRLPERASHASGTLVNLLLEQDEVLLNPLLVTINRALSKAWSLALRIVQDNYNVSRFVRFIGDDGQSSIMKFLGADLRGNTDVMVVSQSGLPRSRALKADYIVKLREVGLLRDDKRTLEMLEFGQAEKLFEDELLHEKVAYRENEIIENNPDISPDDVVPNEEGQGGWIHPLEPLEIHLKIHMRLRFSPKFNRLNDNQKAALENLLMATAGKLEEQRKAQIEETIRMAVAEQAMKSDMRTAQKIREKMGEGKGTQSAE